MTHQATLTRLSLQNAPALAVTNSTPQKHATSEVAFPTTREVYLALSADDETHALVMARFRNGGGDLQRWSSRDRRIMAESVTRVEDQVELRRNMGGGIRAVDAGGKLALRLSLRTIRRRLEDSEVAR